MPAPIASWNPERDVWESAEMDLFSELSVVYSETFPVSGSMRSGQVYARPTSVPLTDGSASSSSPGLLQTPVASDRNAVASEEAMRNQMGSRNSPGLDCLPMLLQTPLTTTATGVQQLERQVGGRGALLPTPTVSDTKGAGQHGTGGPDLRTALSLLPTPKATDGTKGGPNQRGSSGDLTLPSAAMTLLPTPTAVPYGNNQSPSPGAAVRPSLDSLAPMLLPTPTAGDAKASRNSTATRNKLPPTGIHAGDTLTDALVPKEAI